jgi:hypothetical protein
LPKSIILRLISMEIPKKHDIEAPYCTITCLKPKSVIWLTSIC